MIEQLDTVMAEDDGIGKLPGNYEEDENRRTELDVVVFNFCISLIKQKVYKQRYVNPLFHFTSILGIGSDAISWITCHSFTRFLTGFIWCNRMLILEHLFEGEPLEDESGSKDESDSDSINDKRNEAVVERFLIGYRTWLADGTYTPMSVIIY
jgi:hypothetical protein